MEVTLVRRSQRLSGKRTIHKTNTPDEMETIEAYRAQEQIVRMSPNILAEFNSEAFTEEILPCQQNHCIPNEKEDTIVYGSQKDLTNFTKPVKKDFVEIDLTKTYTQDCKVVELPQKRSSTPVLKDSKFEENVQRNEKKTPNDLCQLDIPIDLSSKNFSTSTLYSCKRFPEETFRCEATEICKENKGIKGKKARKTTKQSILKENYNGTSCGANPTRKRKKKLDDTFPSKKIVESQKMKPEPCKQNSAIASTETRKERKVKQETKHEVKLSQLPVSYPPHFNQQIIPKTFVPPVLNLMPMDTNEKFAPIESPNSMHNFKVELTDNIRSSTSTPSLTDSFKYNLCDAFGTDNVKEILGIDDRVLYKLRERHVRALAIVLNINVHSLKDILNKISQMSETIVEKLEEASLMILPSVQDSPISVLSSVIECSQSPAERYFSSQKTISN